MASKTTNSALAFFVGVAVGFAIAYVVFQEDPPPTPTHIPDSLPDSTATVFVQDEPSTFEMSIPIKCKRLEFCESMAEEDTISYVVESLVSVPVESDGSITYNIIFDRIEYSETSQAKAYLDNKRENLIVCFAMAYDPESETIPSEGLSCNSVERIEIISEEPLDLILNVTGKECEEWVAESFQESSPD